MEPLKINIEVSLSETTLRALDRILGHASQPKPETGKPQDAKPAPQESVNVKHEETAAAAAEAPQNEPETSRKSEISNEEMMAATKDAVARLRKAGKDSKFIRTDIFAKYGCSTSTGCPQERRAELLEELANLS